MLLKTHVSTSLALSVVVDNYLCDMVDGYSTAYLARLYLISISVMQQYVIDAVGHKWKSVAGRSIPVRNRLHSLPALLLLSCALGLLAVYALGSLLVLGVPVSAALLHWLEDLLTEGGVYIFRKRVRLPVRFRYDSPLLNRATAVIFAVLLLVCAKPFASAFNFLLSSIALISLLYTFLSV